VDGRERYEVVCVFPILQLDGNVPFATSLDGHAKNWTLKARPEAHRRECPQWCIGCDAAELQARKTIAVGDRITIDASKNTLSVALSNDELAVRRQNWQMPPYKAERGTLAKYIRLVKSASEGCVTDE
jgi:Dehydratase family